MQLFSGIWKNGQINWKLEDEIAEQDVFVEDFEIFSEEDEEITMPFALVEKAPVFPGCESLTENDARKCTVAAFNKFFQRKFNTETLDYEGKQIIRVVFTINTQGNIENVKGRSDIPELESEAERVIYKLPRMIAAKQNGKNVSVRYSLPIIFGGDEGALSEKNISTNKRKRDSILTKKVENKLEKKDVPEVSTIDLSQYILKSSKLGWINCDRFIRAKEKLNYNLYVTDSEGEVRVNMVFKSLNSVLKGRKTESKFNFGSVPANRNVKLVAIKKHKDKLYLDIVETKTSKNPNVTFNFEEVNLLMLKKQLDKLNK